MTDRAWTEDVRQLRRCDDSVGGADRSAALQGAGLMMAYRPGDDAPLHSSAGVSLRPCKSYSDVGAEISRSLADLGLDPHNPFAEYLSHGDSVTIKPNWVMHGNPLGHNLDSLVTHPAVVEHVARLAALGIRTSGVVRIGDAPIQACDFDLLMKKLGMRERLTKLAHEFPRVEFLLEDWRLTRLDSRGQQTVSAVEGVTHRLVDRGLESFLEEVSDKHDRFRVTCYAPSMMAAHHCSGKHEYLVSEAALDSQLLINVPKLKTHKKAGLTGALKNVVGINGHKEYLPHHVQGSPRQNGDEYRDTSLLRRLSAKLYDHVWERRGAYGRLRLPTAMAVSGYLDAAARRLGDNIEAGSWNGNDTVWRMTLDLNQVLYEQRRGPTVHIVDAVVAGQGEGPLSPKPISAGFVISGFNPAQVDAVIARLIGYDPKLVPTVARAMQDPGSRFAGPWDFPVRIDGESSELTDVRMLGFQVPYTWETLLGGGEVPAK